MPRILSALVLLLLSAPALAVTGQAPPATGWAARPIVMITNAREELCTGTAIARDLVLTAAHCVTRSITYQVKIFQNGQTIRAASAVQHPQFNFANYSAARATADVALIKLSQPLPDILQPASLAPARRVAAGEALTIAGFGVTADHTAQGLGQPRMAKLTVTGVPGSLQIRLYDAATRNLNNGLGACTGDSGGPAFDGPGTKGNGQVIGVVSWTTAPRDEDGCGGLTGVTPLLNYRTWILETAGKLGSPLP